jgi:NAD+ synthase (glutamine-hydrolysing)
MDSVFTRVAAVTPVLNLAHVSRNSEVIITQILALDKKEVDIIVFPELCMTGYTCGDLFEQELLLESCLRYLESIVEDTKNCASISVLGLPFSFEGRLFNCAAVIGNGQIYGLVPKSAIPNCGEFYEKRWFSSGVDIQDAYVEMGEHKDIPFGTDVLFQSSRKDWKLGVEICEDLWSVIPPSSLQSINGANIIANLSASNDLVGKVDYRRQLVSQQSARCVAAYIYCSSGFGESSTDLVFSGHRIIAENGAILAEADDFSDLDECIISDIDLQILKHERHKNTELKTTIPNSNVREINISNPLRLTSRDLLRVDSRLPFVPSDSSQRQRVCDQIFNIQSAGLARRLKHMGYPVPVIGISGGLDSTLALLVTAKALEMLGEPVSGICAVTMPGFGTSERTLENSKNLIEGFGIPFRSISIIDSVRQHFKDINHDESNHNVVYENAQARERTKILMDIANQKNGMVVGTGDLSEAALGWCTYNGDHMSMYHMLLTVASIWNNSRILPLH